MLGRLGLGPHDLANDDAVFILSGVETPFVFRKLETGQYRLVGECYLYGILDGEAVPRMWCLKLLMLSSYINVIIGPDFIHSSKIYAWLFVNDCHMLGADHRSSSILPYRILTPLAQGMSPELFVP